MAVSIDGLIDSLSDGGSPVSSSLLRAKVLLHALQVKDPVEWINHELNGYAGGVDIPPYRELPSVVLGDMSNGAWRYSSYQIPLTVLTPEQRDSFENLRIRESLAEIDKLCSIKGALTKPIPPEICALLSKGLNGGYHIERAWHDVSRSGLENISFQVRSRLLDFLLELRLRFPGKTSNSGLSIAERDAVSAVFQSSVFGDNATVIVGTGNTGVSMPGIAPSDFSALTHHLLELGISKESVTELKSALDAEISNGQKPSLGGRVAKWLGEQTAKAASGVISKGAEQLTPALIAALKSYLGM